MSGGSLSERVKEDRLSYDFMFHPTQNRSYGDVLLSQSLGLVLKKPKQTEHKQAIQEQK